MDDAPSTVRTAPVHTVSSESSSSPPWTWLLVGALATTALSLAAAHAPSRIRLIGLFSIAFGALIGWLLVQLMVRFEAHPSFRVLGWTAVVFTVCGLVGSSWETWRLEQRSQPKSVKDAVATRMIEQMQAPQHSTPEEPVPIELPVWTSFRQYLTRRVRQLGTWSSPWPELFWALEIILAAITSFWMATRGQIANEPVPNET